MSVKFRINSAGVNQVNAAVWNGMAEMAYDIQRNAQRRAPVVSGDLRRSIHWFEVKNGEQLEVVAGGTFNGVRIDYAELREEGPNRNPATEHYMANSIRDVMSGDWQKRYFGGLL